MTKLWGTIALLALVTAAPESYRAEIEQWRADREARLKADDGWLSLAGLRWLQEGRTRFGTAADNDFVLPAGSAPAHVGAFELRDGVVRVELEPNSGATLGGESVTQGTMRPDTSGEPDILRLPPRLTMYVIERGRRIGIRLKDTEADTRVSFRGLEWFPVDEAWRKQARWVPYDPPHTLKIPNILGDVSDDSCPGYAVFDVGGKQVRLEPVVESGDSDYFFIFRDATSGHGTYGSGRFLYAAPPENGTIVLDFNKAYSPPCAFTPYATCPLPPPGNRLTVAITAGEKHAAGH